MKQIYLVIEIDRLRAVNKQLLEACKMAVKSIDNTIARYPLAKTDRPEIAAQLRAAISAAEGGAEP